MKIPTFRWRIAGLIIIIAATVFALYRFISYKNDNAELFFPSRKNWAWYDKENGIQISFYEDVNRSVLRKVFWEDQYAVYAYKNDDYSLSATVAFLADCVPGSEIITSRKYSDGTPMKLQCDEKGKALLIDFHWDNKNPKFVWNEDLDGFKVRVDFSKWDFTKLDQEVTLSKAK